MEDQKIWVRNGNDPWQLKRFHSLIKGKCLTHGIGDDHIMVWDDCRLTEPEKNKTDWLRLLLDSMPLPDQIKNFDTKGTDVYFEWRKNTYKIETKTCCVWLAKGGMLNGDDCSTLIEHILKSKLK